MAKTRSEKRIRAVFSSRQRTDVTSRGGVLPSVPCTMKTHTGAKNHACVCTAIVKLTDDLRFFKNYHWIGNFELILKMGFKLKIKLKMTKLWVPKKG